MLPRAKGGGPEGDQEEEVRRVDGTWRAVDASRKKTTHLAPKHVGKKRSWEPCPQP